MSDLTPEQQYKKEYDEAYAALDAPDAEKPVATSAEEVPKEPEAEPKEQPKAEETPEESAPVDLSAIEVEKKGKKEDPDAEEKSE